MSHILTTDNIKVNKQIGKYALNKNNNNQFKKKNIQTGKNLNIFNIVTARNEWMKDVKAPEGQFASSL